GRDRGRLELSAPSHSGLPSHALHRTKRRSPSDDRIAAGHPHHLKRAASIGFKNDRPSPDCACYAAAGCGAVFSLGGRMSRREFIRATAGAAVAWPLAARAQQAGRARRIGWLSPVAGPSEATRAFLQAARERGHVEGQNFSVEYRWAAGKSERLAE